jgi:parallel beta-helix repeat protein
MRELDDRGEQVAQSGFSYRRDGFSGKPLSRTRPGSSSYSSEEEQGCIVRSLTSRSGPTIVQYRAATRGRAVSGPFSPNRLLWAFVTLIVLLLSNLAFGAESVRSAPRSGDRLSDGRHSLEWAGVKRGRPSVGPKKKILCPSHAVMLRPGRQIQHAIDSHPKGTSFCLRAGIYRITRSITPKTRDSFTGKYGAVLNGSGWTTTDPSEGAFRARNQDIDNVTIRNLVIRNMPAAGVNTLYGGPDSWVIDHNEIANCQVGINHADYAVVTHNYIHHNRQYGITGFRSTGGLIAKNEIALNNTIADWPGDMGASKWAEVSNTTIRGNYVHNNYHHGIWLDGSGTGNLIEGNLIVHNEDDGIFDEISGQVVIRNNRTARNTGHGIFIANSQQADVHDNTVVRNGGVEIELFLDGNRVAAEGKNLMNNLIHDNFIDASDSVPFTNNLAAALGCINATDGCAAVAESNNNRFVHNTYKIPTRSGKYFYFEEQHRTWSEWQAIGMDTTGTVNTG